VIRNEGKVSEIDSFYDIYIETMNRVNAVQYLYFNKNYFTDLMLSSNAIQLIAMFENKPIASLILLHADHYIHTHLGGAKTEFLNLSPYSILNAEVIKIGIEKGGKYFHLGGGLSSDENDSVFKFKSNFSNTHANFYVGKKVHNQVIYDDAVKQWEERNPELKDNYKHHLLKYRY